MRSAAVLLLMLIGCWGARTATVTPPIGPAESTGPSTLALRNTHHGVSPCVAVVAHAIDVSRPEIDHVPELRDHVDELRDAAIESCMQTDWSNETLQCYGEAATSLELGKCSSLMTSEQNEDLNRRLLEVIGASAPAAAPTP